MDPVFMIHCKPSPPFQAEKNRVVLDSSDRFAFTVIEIKMFFLLSYVLMNVTALQGCNRQDSEKPRHGTQVDGTCGLSEKSFDDQSRLFHFSDFH